MGALLWGAAAGTTSAALAEADQSVAHALAGHLTSAVLSGYAAPDFYPASPVGDLLARRGRGADDPQPPKCDDHGTDLCVNAVENIARRGRGADDPQPPKCDDHGTDLCMSRA